MKVAETATHECALWLEKQILAYGGRSGRSSITQRSEITLDPRVLAM